MKKWKRAPSAPYKTDPIKDQPERRGCVKGTRKRVRKHIVRWATNPSSPPIMWLSGMAGEGKSTIAFTICEIFDEDRHPNKPPGASLGGSFFCSRQVENLRRRQNIIPMLAYQLAGHSHSFAEELDKANRAKPDAIDTSSGQVEKFLITPWKASIKDRPAALPLTLIVIDALDEIDGNGGEELLKELIQATQKTGRDSMHGLKILVTSRPHPSIVDATKNSLPVYRLEDIEAKEGRKDILTFLSRKLSSLSKQDHELIADRAQGLFIYAATIVLALSDQTEKEQKKALAKILSSSQQTNYLEALDALYMQVLAANLKGKFISRLVVLHCIICILRPLPVLAIAQVAAGAVEEDLDEDATRRLVEGLHSVLYISEKDSCVYIYHKSFSDFLLDGDRSGPKYACNLDLLHPTISLACFRIMQASLRFNICNLPSSYLFDSDVDGLRQSIQENIADVAALEYACRSWTSHLVKVPIVSKDLQPLRDKLWEFSQEKVLYWVEVMNLLEAKVDCCAGVNAVKEWANKHVGILLSMT
jgi:hypothetical protein